jgi:hypothetical protein
MAFLESGLTRSNDHNTLETGRPRTAKTAESPRDRREVRCDHGQESTLSMHDKLPDPWIINTEYLLEKLEKCRESVMNIPIRSLEETQLGIRYALTEIVNLQDRMRYVLEYYRQAQQRWAKKAQPVKKHTVPMIPAQPKSGSIRA